MKKEQTYIDAGGDVLQTPIRNNDSCCDLTSMQLKKKAVANRDWVGIYYLHSENIHNGLVTKPTDLIIGM